MEMDINGTSIRFCFVLGTLLDTGHTIQNGNIVLKPGFYNSYLTYLADFNNVHITVVNGSTFAGWDAPSLKANKINVGTLLADDICDVGAPAHEFNVFRSSILTFLHPIISDRLFGFFVQPPASSIRNIFIQGFQLHLWLSIIFVWLFFLLGMFSITIVKQILLGKRGGLTKEYMTNVIVWATGIACQQGGFINPSTISGKGIVLCTLLTSLIIYQAYSASLVSILAFKVIPIKTEKDLHAAQYSFISTNYGDCACPSPYVLGYLQDLGQKYPHLRNDNNLTIPKLAAERILKGDAVYAGVVFDFLPIAYHNLGIEIICSKISKVTLDRYPMKLAMIVRKGSPWKEFLNTKTITSMNNGILHRLHKNYNRNAVTPIMCASATANQNESLGWNDIFMAVFVFCIISSFSCVCLVFEMRFPAA